MEQHGGYQGSCAMMKDGLLTISHLGKSSCPND